MKQIIKKSLKKVLITFITIMLAVLIAIFTGTPSLELFCINHPMISSMVILILIGICLCLMIWLFIIISDIKETISNDKQKEYKLKSYYKPFVLVFDDEIETLKDIEEYLAKECNTVLLSDMTHECLADRFDIIIGDINNIGYGYKHKNASSILNEIIRNDPYKMVIMITNDSSQAIELDKRIIIVPKDKNNNYLRDLLVHIKNFKESIIDLDSYWKKWKEQNNIKRETKEAKRIKERFYNHFKESIEIN